LLQRSRPTGGRQSDKKEKSDRQDVVAFHAAIIAITNWGDKARRYASAMDDGALRENENQVRIGSCIDKKDRSHAI
jgi:hypothetical protein